MLPKLIVVLKEGYKAKQFFQDLSAGIIVGIIALPLSIVLAIASGVKPEQGLFASIVMGIIVSVFGGTRVQIGGPTGTLVVVLYSLMQTHDYNAVCVAGIIAGILLILFGIFKFGNVIKFIPYPVTIGFTGGMGVIIFELQLKDFLGLKIGKMPIEFHNKLIYLFKNLDSFNIYSFIIGILTIVILIFWNKFFKKIPASLIAIIFTTLLVNILNIPVDTIGSIFGEVPNMLSMPKLPDFSYELVKEMFPIGLVIALLAGIEALLSAVVADGMTGFKHNSNMELIAQGLGNIFTPIFGGIPSTGVIARTATNVKNGARSPIAGIIHSITILLIMLFFAKYAAYVPMACLSGILMVVAYNMSEIRHFKKIFKSPKSDIFVLMTSFFLTIFADLTKAIEIGVILAALLFIKRMSEVSKFKLLVKEDEDFEGELKENINIPNDVEIFEINGPFFFGATATFKENMRELKIKPKILILRMRHVPVIDATGISTLEWVIESLEKEGTKVILSGVSPYLFNIIKKTEIYEKLSLESICKNIEEALKRAENLLK